MHAWARVLFLWQPACHLLPPLPPPLQDKHQPVGFEWWRQLPAEADCALTPLCTLDQEYLPQEPLGYTMVSLS